MENPSLSELYYDKSKDLVFDSCTQINLKIDEVSNYRDIYGIDFFKSKQESIDEGQWRLIIKEMAQRGAKRINIICCDPKNGELLYELFMEAAKNSYESILFTTTAGGFSDKISDYCSIGVNRVNILLDTLKEFKYKQQTGRNLKEVFLFIDLCVKIGVETNIVPMIIKDFNSSEMFDFMMLTLNRRLNVIFTELANFAAMENFYEIGYFNVYDALYETEGIFMNKEKSKNRDEIIYFNLDKAKGMIGVYPMYLEGKKEAKDIVIDMYGNLYNGFYPEESINIMFLMKNTSTFEREIGFVIGYASK